MFKLIRSQNFRGLINVAKSLNNLHSRTSSQNLMLSRSFCITLPKLEKET